MDLRQPVDMSARVRSEVQPQEEGSMPCVMLVYAVAAAPVAAVVADLWHQDRG